MLTNTACKNAKPKEKPYKLPDGGGLYLLVKINGAKHWRLKYYYLGKEKLLALGPYPMLGLAEAREARDNAKKLLAAGHDPVSKKQENKRVAIRNSLNTFQTVALEWHENQIAKWSEHHALNVMRRLDVDIFPYIGARPIAELDAPELLEALRRIEKRGALDVAARARWCPSSYMY